MDEDDNGKFRLERVNVFKFLTTWDCLASVIHNLKWLQITHICLIWDQTFTNIGV